MLPLLVWPMVQRGNVEPFFHGAHTASAKSVFQKKKVVPIFMLYTRLPSSFYL
jgi:hypothetical protein